MGRIIGIDYGLKRVGLAVTDPMQIVSSPLDTVPSDQLFKFIESYLEREKVDEIVVGMPKNLSNMDTDATSLVREFIKRFKVKFPDLPIFTVDERYTSKIASSAILASGVNKKKRRDKKLVDKVSASLILQSYMEQKSIL